jgi:uncharacterized damage-inducible protein DinB
MSIAQGMLAEIEHEAAATRALLSRVPDRPDWKPHPKSMAMGRLAGHIAELTRWGATIAAEDVFVLDPTKYAALAVETAGQAVDAFDRGLEELKAALAPRTDAEMLRTWRMVVGGKTVIEMPRVAVLRNMVLNHTVHHRAQLGVYLRLNDVALPSTYGGSADEGGLLP